MPDCIFCKIINKEIPTKPVFEDQQVIVIRDIDPKAPVHLLAIPKKHIVSLAEEISQPEGIYGHLLRIVSQTAREQGISQSGYRVIINVGKNGR